MASEVSTRLTLCDSSGRSDCQSVYHEGEYSVLLYCFVYATDENGKIYRLDKNKVRDNITLTNYITTRNISEVVNYSVIEVFESMDFEYSNELIVSFKITKTKESSFTIPIGVRLSYPNIPETINWRVTGSGPLYLSV